MNHRRSVAAVAILAAVAFAACGEADDAVTTPTRRTPVSANQVEQAALAETKAHADALEAWSYYYRVTHPEMKAAPAVIRNPVSADAAERRAAAEATAAIRIIGSADAAEHRATVEVTVEREVLRRGVDIKR